MTLAQAWEAHERLLQSRAVFEDNEKSGNRIGARSRRWRPNKVLLQDVFQENFEKLKVRIPIRRRAIQQDEEIVTTTVFSCIATL